MTHVNPTAEDIVSPKVIAAAAANIVGLAVVAGLAAITPDLLEGLGPWNVVIYAAIATVGASLAGYLKRDPLRL